MANKKIPLNICSERTAILRLRKADPDVIVKEKLNNIIISPSRATVPEEAVYLHARYGWNVYHAAGLMTFTPNPAQIPTHG